MTKQILIMAVSLLALALAGWWFVYWFSYSQLLVRLEYSGSGYAKCAPHRMTLLNLNSVTLENVKLEFSSQDFMFHDAGDSVLGGGLLEEATGITGIADGPGVALSNYTPNFTIDSIAPQLEHQFSLVDKLASSEENRSFLYQLKRKDRKRSISMKLINISSDQGKLEIQNISPHGCW